MFFFVGILVLSCSTKKNTFANRSVHAITAKYNILYNGNIAFDQAKKQLDDTYEDNFWERLPIEPMKTNEEVILMPGQSQVEPDEKQGFEKAEEKAVKAIQKHSMVIDDFEKNSQIDEAYFLLGKSRYYLQRFIPALEAFSFGLEKYPNANLYVETKIWKAKTHIRLQHDNLAIETLQMVLRNAFLTEEMYEQAHTTMAMIYTQLDSTHLVIDHLKKSTTYLTDESQNARNLFILGQIYREENKIDSSNMVFENLSYMKDIPRKYMVHATIERAKNYSEADSTSVIVYALHDLMEDRDNRPYLDELYYQAAYIAQEQGYINNAYDYYKKSVAHNKGKPYQKGLSYEKLGDLYFDDTKFEIAEAYYDSVLRVTKDQNTKRIRRLVRKKESLKDVIYYENIAKVNDSILQLSNMTPEAQEAYFQEYINALKIKDEEEKERIELEQRLASTGNNEFNDSGSFNPINTGNFYFYNIQTVGRGVQEFKRKYGSRPLVDNWIISGSSGITKASLDDQNESLKEVDNSLKYEISFYVDQIPTNEIILDSLISIRNDAYYNLGLIYKEQFKEYELAAANFEDFLKNDPVEKLILPAKYHLYKCYEFFNEELSNKFRDEIVKEYPDSRYSAIILNPKKVLVAADDENSPENIYKNAYVCYEEEDYEYALESIEEAIDNVKGAEIEPKFELLRAYILFKIEGEEAFVEKLNGLIINYPATEESKHAESVLEKMQTNTLENKVDN